MMQPRIKVLEETRFVGKRIYMSLAQNKTKLLWQSFIPELKDVKNRSSKDLYSIEVYDPDYFKQFSPSTEFEKWAAVIVTDFDDVPDAMETLIAPAGLYAIFVYRGAASEGAQFFQRIFGAWLPASEYALDTRPHFAVMGDKYKNDDPNSEEEIWIPIKPKS